MTAHSSRIPQPTATIGAIPAYVPGKPPVAREGLTTYKRSPNENPYPPLPGVVEAVSEVVSRMNRYPDMGNVDLFAALATRLDVPVEDLTLATGSLGLISQALQAFCDPADEVVPAWSSFEDYPIADTAAAATSVRAPVTATGESDLQAMRSARRRG